MQHILQTLFAIVSLISTNGKGIEADISWEFDGSSLDGWANSTTEQMNMEVKLENGELRGTIVGWNPILDSPMIFLETENRHYVALRLMYYGEADVANLLLRYGPQTFSSTQAAQADVDWKGRFVTLAVSSSVLVPIYQSHSFELATDGDFYTSWRSTTKYGSWVVLDLSISQWITGFTIWSSGDTNSPRKCLLQKSNTQSGIGPFETISTFILEKTSSKQILSGGTGAQARYWRILFLDNYDGDVIEIREIELNGYQDLIAVVPIPNFNNKGIYQTYYLPIHDYARGPLIRLRLELIYQSKLQKLSQYEQLRPLFHEGFALDFLHILRAPELFRIRGCVDTYYPSPTLQNPTFNVTSVTQFINNQLPVSFYTQNTLRPVSFPYVSTYDCPVTGNIPIVIEGLNFGDDPIVTVSGQSCAIVKVEVTVGVTRAGDRAGTKGGREQSITCMLPPLPTSSLSPLTGSKVAVVRVANGWFPSGIFQETSSLLSYRTTPPTPSPPRITNIASSKVDLVWSSPGNPFQNMVVTGYKILYFRPEKPQEVNNMTVGNVTTTSVTGLTPNTSYIFRIASVSEGVKHENAAALPTDLYGRREFLSEAFLSSFSPLTTPIKTLPYDFSIFSFDANMTLNHSTANPDPYPDVLNKHPVNSDGPTGMYGGEGFYGLSLVGSAHIENCNVSFSCCDGYNATVGVSSCKPGRSVCAVLFERILHEEFVINGISRNRVETNEPYPDGGSPQIVVLTLEELRRIKGAMLPSRACGPSLRITPSRPRQSGSVWYRRKQNVREGFDTSFTFHISNPSTTCNRQDDVNTHCRSRGADGLAFVLQGVGLSALGDGGKGLGYEGIWNALAVEVDTYFNYDQLDFYENHISVLTKGFRYNISANHSYALATTTQIPDLTDHEHTLRIRYEPNFREEDTLHPSFQAGGYTSWFLENADYKNGGTGDWGVGMGLLYVYLDDLYSPVITTPLNLDKTLQLDSGRMYVGITGATGERNWQAHDVLNWTFNSLHHDKKYTQPLIVNGEGAYECVNSTVCVNEVDYSHYPRRNSIWDAPSDAV